MNVDAPSEKPLNFRYWPDYMKSRVLTFQKRKLLTDTTRVFTMGSCFALEVRRALGARGFDLYPKYAAVPFDKKLQIFEKVPERDTVAHYDTFSMRQEFEAAFGLFTDRAKGFWNVEGERVNKFLNSPTVCQDPYRKMNYAVDTEQMSDLAGKIDAALLEGIERSDVFVITLGLTEVWRHKITGRYLCRPPGTGYGGGTGQATFHQSTFVENYENMRALLDLLLKHFPEKQVVISVSPVPLDLTFSPTDIGTANLESKSILRAVAGQICREYKENVLYLPSYEMATIIPGPVFEEDGRHVLPEFVDKVISTFINKCS